MNACRSILGSTLFGLLLPACGIAPEEGMQPVASRTSAIVNGSIDTKHNYVVQVSPTNGDFKPCTGTVIGTRTVLTAAHCVSDAAHALYPDMRIIANDRSYVGTPVRHPSYRGGLGNADIALILLDTPISGINYAVLSRYVDISQRLWLVGYGQPSRFVKDYGTRRGGSNSIARVLGDFFYFSTPVGTEAVTCYGDSGGPAFGGNDDSNCLVGVTVGQELGVAGSPCTPGGGSEWYDTRIDSFAGWIRANARETIDPPCVAGL